MQGIVSFSKLLSVIFVWLLIISCESQSKNNDNKTIDYYFKEIGQLEMKEMLNQNILIDSVTIANKYKDSVTNGLSSEGFQKYADIKMKIYQSYFKDYLYLQKVEYKNDIYVLYFTMAGFDDMQWDIIKWKKDKWNEGERLSREKVKNDGNIEKILWNYDEGEKNAENSRIFIQNDYLVMERGNLYHSLYDLKKQKVILNEESPWHASNTSNKIQMNKWIKENLHDKIEKYLN